MSHAVKRLLALLLALVPNYGTYIESDENTLGDPEVTTIYGNEDSTAEAYVQNYHYVFKTLKQFNPFLDVTSGKYYYKAVLWAREMGITSGVDDRHFGVEQTCTRAQYVTFLYSAKDIAMG